MEQITLQRLECKNPQDLVGNNTRELDMSVDKCHTRMIYKYGPIAECDEIDCNILKKMFLL